MEAWNARLSYPVCILFFVLPKPVVSGAVPSVPGPTNASGNRHGRHADSAADPRRPEVTPGPDQHNLTPVSKLRARALARENYCGWILGDIGMLLDHGHVMRSSMVVSSHYSQIPPSRADTHLPHRYAL